MLKYLERKQTKLQTWDPQNPVPLKNAVWIDLLSPSKTEEKLLEEQLGFSIPTRADMIEIELSSRLYSENDNYFMTVTMIAHSDTSNEILDPVTFVITKHQLITVRYVEPQSFKLFNIQAEKLAVDHRDPVFLLIAILDASVEKLADTLELVGHRLDSYSQSIFNRGGQAEKNDYQQLMQQMGSIADLNTKARESLVTFGRLLTFFSPTIDPKTGKEKWKHLNSIAADIVSLSDHASFLSTKINFLLDATLGMVNIDQNNVIKILSVAAVIFLPPTLIASIYGMNFQSMPELSWKYGYWFTIGLMFLSTWLPYKYFKYRKWF